MRAQRATLLLSLLCLSQAFGIAPDPHKVTGPVLGAYHHVVSFEADFLLMDRSQGSRRPLAVSSGGAIDPTLNANPSCDKPEGSIQLTSRNLINAQGYQPGVSAAMYIYPDNENSLEGRWMGLLSWNGEDKVQCPQNLSCPVVGMQTYDWAHASEIRGQYQSKLWGAEFDYIRHLTPRYIAPFSISARAGLHYVNLKEELELFTSKQGALVTESGNEWDYSTYRVNTKSQFFGLQSGLDFEYNPMPALTWGVRVKGGLGANWGSSKTWMGDLNNSLAILDYGNCNSNFAYIFTGYPFIELRPVKNWTLTTIYEVLYLGAFTVAEKQAIFREKFFENNFEKINNHGYFFCHGLRIALKCNF